MPETRTPGRREIDRLLTALEAARRERGAQHFVESALSKLAAIRILDASRLIRLHEAALYFRAHPSRASVLRQAERVARRIGPWVRNLDEAGADLSPLEDSNRSGIAGTSVTLALSFEILLWLRNLRGARVDVAWDADAETDNLASMLSRFLPLLEEEALADANVPYAEWVASARGGRSALEWFLDRFEVLVPDPRDRAERFDSLGLPVEWRLGGSRWSRTALRTPAARPFFHGHRLRDNAEMRADPIATGAAIRIRRISTSAASRILSAARAALATRYREIYGFTYGETRGAIQADAGRGVRFFLFGLPPDRRLPVRAGFTALVARNGVPIGYGDAFALFERVDLSFNIFPEFRDGESAFVFRALLGLYRRVLGSTVFSIEPYQIGLGNEEAIGSGAFWFYRRLGFRPANAELEKLALREEAQIASNPGYRSSARVLGRLAGSNMLLETESSARNEWDNFHIRNPGLEVNRRNAARPISPAALREAAARRVAKTLRIRTTRGSQAQRLPVADLIIVLDSIRDLPKWSRSEKDALAKILDAKLAASEVRYVRLLRKHARLRRAVLRLGSRHR